MENLFNFHNYPGRTGLITIATFFRQVTARSPPVVTTACPVGHLLENGSRSPQRWIEIVDLPIKKGDFPMKNVDFPMKNGDFPMKNGDFPMKHGDFP
jgi:hypothetical protein